MSLTKMEGLVGLVTGAASGLGRATTIRLVGQGVKGIAALDLQPLGQEVTSLPRVLPLTGVDVSNEESVKSALESIKKTFGRLDFVVNCAGIGGNACKFYDFDNNKPYDLESFKRVIEVNLFGTFNVTRLAVGLMAETVIDGTDGQRGCIVLTSSIAGTDGPSTGHLPYVASKAAIAGMTLSMARELGGQGIRCVTLAPGIFETPMISRDIPEAGKKHLSSIIPCPSRLGVDQEFAHLVQTVIQNNYLNGTVIRLDGALRMP